jgi:hypothetical protein
MKIVPYLISLAFSPQKSFYLGHNTQLNVSTISVPGFRKLLARYPSY